MKDLRSLRTIAGVSQFTCARKAHVPRVRLSLHESGQMQLNPEEEGRVRAVLLRSVEVRTLQLQTVLAESGAEGGTEVTR
jgi:hypothetical protein